MRSCLIVDIIPFFHPVQDPKCLHHPVPFTSERQWRFFKRITEINPISFVIEFLYKFNFFSFRFFSLTLRKCKVQLLNTEKKITYWISPKLEQLYCNLSKEWQHMRGKHLSTAIRRTQKKTVSYESHWMSFTESDKRCQNSAARPKNSESKRSFFSCEVRATRNFLFLLESQLLLFHSAYVSRLPDHYY